MKLWHRNNEWTSYASCRGSIDHTIPPTRDPDEQDRPVANRGKVVDICGSCRVRPECIKWALKPGPAQPVDVWVAGRFIPMNKRQARKVRQQLADSLEGEFEARGDDI
jgi:hypothetical protein